MKGDVIPVVCTENAPNETGNSKSPPPPQNQKNILSPLWTPLPTPSGLGFETELHCPPHDAAFMGLQGSSFRLFPGRPLQAALTEKRVLLLLCRCTSKQVPFLPSLVRHRLPRPQGSLSPQGHPIVRRVKKGGRRALVFPSPRTPQPRHHFDVSLLSIRWIVVREARRWTWDMILTAGQGCSLPVTKAGVEQGLSPLTLGVPFP